MLVRDQASAAKLLRFVGGLRDRAGQPGTSGARVGLIERRARELGIGLAGDDWLRPMATQPEQRPESRKAFFSASADVLPAARGLGMGVAGLRVPGDDRPERLAEQARSYRAAMRVPFETWTAGDTAAVRRIWGAARDASRPRRLAAAVEELQSLLDRQLVVWLEGRLLPNEIDLTAEGRKHVDFPGASRQVAADLAGRARGLDVGAPQGVVLPRTSTPRP